MSFAIKKKVLKKYFFPRFLFSFAHKLLLQKANVDTDDRIENCFLLFLLSRLKIRNSRQGRAFMSYQKGFNTLPRVDPAPLNFSSSVLPLCHRNKMIFMFKNDRAVWSLYTSYSVWSVLVSLYTKDTRLGKPKKLTGLNNFGAGLQGRRALRNFCKILWSQASKNY